MNINVERNLGEQPLVKIMEEESISPKDLVLAQSNQVSFKLVSRALKGRRLTINSKNKILLALNHVTNKAYQLKDIFTY